MGNELDMVVLGNCVLREADQDPGLRRNYSLSLEADLTLDQIEP
jgi:carbamoyltransferase